MGLHFYIRKSLLLS